ncbi:MAG: hypothetical protein COA49_03310 [Bacteroidetes bacterium]|nr:MAG: hypothetical protein COA49_03310 [Bacteroidota bacterium]
MYDLFISTEYFGLPDLAMELAGLIIIMLFLLWSFKLIGFIRKRNSNLSIGIRLKMIQLTGLGIVLLLLAVYVAILYLFNGTHSFQWLAFEWDSSNTYLRLLPQIIIFVLAVSLFYNEYNKMTQLLKK